MPAREPGTLGLAVVRGRDAGARVILGDAPLRIGRGRDVDLVLTDPSVSRRHVEVTAAGDRVRVAACRGAAPFLVGDKDVVEAELGEGERIIIGDTILEVF